MEGWDEYARILLAAIIAAIVGGIVVMLLTAIGCPARETYLAGLIVALNQYRVSYRDGER